MYGLLHLGQIRSVIFIPHFSNVLFQRCGIQPPRLPVLQIGVHSAQYRLRALEMRVRQAAVVEQLIDHLMQAVLDVGIGHAGADSLFMSLVGL